jgi:hypothetical protein
MAKISDVLGLQFTPQNQIKAMTETDAMVGNLIMSATALETSHA